MTDPSQLLHTRLGGVLHLEMNNPKRRNGLTLAMADALCAGFEDAAKDSTVRAVLLSGVGGHFSSGADLSSAMEDADPTPEGRRKLADTSLVARFHPALKAIWNCPKPVVAQLDGAAVGFGLSLALACDVRLMAADAYLTGGFLKVGLFPDGAMLWQLDRLIGLSRAMAFVLEGEKRLHAEEALAWGLVGPEALAYAAQLGAGPLQAIAETKRQLHEPPSSFEATLAAEVRPVGDCLASDDVAEGLMAFFEKRPPKFGAAK
jgi:2-(1,2-epoxy-1,2-dihydrophenyl)acetyl-CoA isomerase